MCGIFFPFPFFFPIYLHSPGPSRPHSIRPPTSRPWGATGFGAEVRGTLRKRMGTHSYLLRPRLAPFATSGCPFYLPERGWARNWPPPRSLGLKVLCYCDLSPSSLCCEKNQPRRVHLGPCGGLWRVSTPHSPTRPLFRALRPGSYTLKGQSWYKAAAAHILASARRPHAPTCSAQRRRAQRA